MLPIASNIAANKLIGGFYENIAANKLIGGFYESITSSLISSSSIDPVECSAASDASASATQIGSSETFVVSIGVSSLTALAVPGRVFNFIVLIFGFTSTTLLIVLPLLLPKTRVTTGDGELDDTVSVLAFCEEFEWHSKLMADLMPKILIASKNTDKFPADMHASPNLT
uniref:Uncharacterized protein n=1 Tax=Glossina austeni TaxID=7395 RepID=A0A1A9V4C4_GLOAU